MIADLLRGKFDAADLGAIDAEIARLTALRELVAGAIGPTAPAPEPAAGKAPPAAPNPAPRAKGKPGPKSGANADARRLTIARALEAGPLAQGEIGERTGVGGSAGYYLSSSGWFRKSNPSDRLSPWELTAVGRAALEAARGTTQTPNPVPAST